eukprot:GHVU01002301.1.p1 GENE.GHVU01002301.1~~GHVU01002301.1.p1  ORF type:complete len:117 (-),score=5.24 GHVU01002301.1:162-512(-)
MDSEGVVTRNTAEKLSDGRGLVDPESVPFDMSDAPQPVDLNVRPDPSAPPRRPAGLTDHSYTDPGAGDGIFNASELDRSNFLDTRPDLDNRSSGFDQGSGARPKTNQGMNAAIINK